MALRAETSSLRQKGGRGGGKSVDPHLDGWIYQRWGPWFSLWMGSGHPPPHSMAHRSEGPAALWRITPASPFIFPSWYLHWLEPWWGEKCWILSSDGSSEAPSVQRACVLLCGYPQPLGAMVTVRCQVTWRGMRAAKNTHVLCTLNTLSKHTCLYINVC